MAGVTEVSTLRRVKGSRGEVVLRQRRTGDATVIELIVNGVFAMDSADTTTERALARLVLPEDGGTVLLGGLGLGYTADEVLRRGAARLDIVEVEPALVAWAREGVTPVLARVASDSRVQLRVADVAEILAADGRSWDAIVLDVDNGPDFLIHPSNADLYTAPILRQAYERLTVGGRLAIWSQGTAPELVATLRRVDPAVAEHRLQVRRGQRTFSYAIYTLRRG